jgi:hypothetical protein
VQDGGRPGQRHGRRRREPAPGRDCAGRILRDPANRDLTVGEVLQKLAVPEQAGSSESARFNRALADCPQVVDQCDLRAP